MKKSSKRKQKLHEKFLKKKSPKINKNTKIISNYLKRLKKIPRKNIFKKNLAKNENRLPKKIALESKKITDQKTIAENFNEFYVNWA